MADTVNKKTRSEIMAKVQSRGTKLEKFFFELFETRGWNFFEKHPQDILGHPDLVDRKRKIAIFIDSCFWHGCQRHLRMPTSNTEYWNKKIKRNKKRDKTVRKQLRQDGWYILSFWEHELPNTPSLKGKLTRLSKHLSS